MTQGPAWANRDKFGKRRDSSALTVSAAGKDVDAGEFSRATFPVNAGHIVASPARVLGVQCRAISMAARFPFDRRIDPRNEIAGSSAPPYL
jgi:hypothetical protein